MHSKHTNEIQATKYSLTVCALMKVEPEMISQNIRCCPSNRLWCVVFGKFWVCNFDHRSVDQRLEVKTSLWILIGGMDWKNGSYFLLSAANLTTMKAFLAMEILWDVAWVFQKNFYSFLKGSKALSSIKNKGSKFKEEFELLHGKQAFRIFVPKTE